MKAPVYVLYRTEAGDFEEAVALKNEEGEHIVVRDADQKTVTDRICTEPFAHDLDGDGDLDFIIGTFSGHFLRVINVGSKTEPAFRGTPEFIMNPDGGRLTVKDGNHGAPVVVDWDGDGDDDLMTGSGRGGVQIAENEPGEDGSANYAPFRVLIEAPKGLGYGVLPSDAPITMGTSWRIAVADYNADGKLDVIVGDCLRQTLAKRGDTVEEAKQKQAEWKKGLTEHQAAMREAQKAISEAADDEARQAAKAKYEEALAAYRACYAERGTAVKNVSTGHVWVYLRK